MSYLDEFDKELDGFFQMFDENMELMEMRVQHLSKRKFKEGDNLRVALKQLLKDELVDLCESYDMMGIGKLKKADLITRLEEEIIESIPSRLVMMNTRHFEALELLKAGEVAEDELFIESVGLLEEWGYALSYVKDDDLYAFVPADVYEYIQEEYRRGNVKELAQINREIIDYLDTSLAYYGVATFETLGEQFLKLYGVDVKMGTLYEMMVLNAMFARHVDYDEVEDFFYNVYTDEPAELLDVISELPPENYKVMTRHLVDEFSKHEIIPNETSQTFKKMVIDFSRLPEDEVELMVEEMEESIRHAVPLEEHFKILEEVFDFLDKDKLQKLKDCFEEMFKDIPLWVYKGHSINEMNGKKKRHLKLV